jgi:hypothetical protein
MLSGCIKTQLGGVERNKTPAHLSSIYYITEDTSTSGFWATAILYRPKSLLDDFQFGLFELGGLENVGNAVEIMFLSIMQPKIHELPVFLQYRSAT